MDEKKKENLMKRIETDLGGGFYFFFFPERVIYFYFCVYVCVFVCLCCCCSNSSEPGDDRRLPNDHSSLMGYMVNGLQSTVSCLFLFLFSFFRKEFASNENRQQNPAKIGFIRNSKFQE